jgi:Flp pilus assembly protein TadG
MKNITTGSMARRRRASSGNTIVETALIFLVFFPMLLGAFDFGQFLFIHQALVERARYAARWGAINDATDTASICNMVLYNQSTTPTAGTASYFHLTGCNPGNVVVTNPGSGTDNYYLEVRISGYSYSVLSPYITGSYTGPAITVSVPLGLYN